MGNYFDSLPVDPYIDGHYRYRAYARYQQEVTGFTRLPHQSFCQAEDINRLAGGVKREFAEIDNQMDETEEFQHLLQSFTEYTHPDDPHSIIEVHQIRVICDEDHAGSPAPEGIHQDGFSYVGIFCVQRKHIKGGYTQVFLDPVDQHPHINTVLEENQFMILNDRRYYHYVSETLSNHKGKKGVRDVFVFTT